MKRQCAWCGLLLGAPERTLDLQTTHTICQACAERVLQETELSAIQACEFVDEMSPAQSCLHSRVA